MTRGSIDWSAEAPLGILEDRAALVASMAPAIALSVDAKLRERFRLLAGTRTGQPFAIADPSTGTWLSVGGDDEVTVDRRPPTGLPVLTAASVDAQPELIEALRRSTTSTLVIDEASRLVHPLFRPVALISREQFQALRPWCPLIERVAFASATRISALLDDLRPRVKRDLEEGLRTSVALRLYWCSAHVMAHLLLVAADPEAGPWLVDMARSFEWRTWTPSFGLLRERTAWLAAVAARSALTFGEPVVEMYLRALARANSPLRTFDALYGLTSVALHRPSASTLIAAAVADTKAGHLARTSDHGNIAELAYAHALHVMSSATSGHPIERPPEDLKWRTGAPTGLGTRQALVFDPTTISSQGGITGFSILPFVVSCGIEEHFPKSRALRLINEPDGKGQSAVLRRTWLADEQGPTPFLH